MTIRYARPSVASPPLEYRRPHLPPSDRAAAGTKPPPALPSHCKPWLAAQSIQIAVPYPYQVSLRVSGTDDGYPRGQFTNAAGLTLHDIELTSLSSAFFTINTEYRVVTPDGIGLFVLPAPEAPAQAVSGLVESWWYPKSLFVVFPKPLPGENIWFHPGDLLCSLLPVSCGRHPLEEFDAAGYAEHQRREQTYNDFQRDRTDLQWTSAAGRVFSHAYRAYPRTRTEER